MLTYWALLMVIINHKSEFATKSVVVPLAPIDTQVVTLYTSPDTCAQKAMADGPPTHTASSDVYFTCVMVQIPR